MQEFELIQLAQKDDQNALKELLQENYAILKGYLLKMTFNRELADDLAQETMLKAILKIKKFKGHSKFSTWLIRIATNLYRDHLKKNRRLLVVENLERTYADREMNDKDFWIAESLAKLPPEKKSVLILKHYFGYSYEEIAKILKCPVGTAKSRMHYCLEFLRSEMKGGMGC